MPELAIIVSVLGLLLALYDQRRHDQRLSQVYSRHFTTDELRALGRNADGTLRDA